MSDPRATLVLTKGKKMELEMTTPLESLGIIPCEDCHTYGDACYDCAVAAELVAL